MTPDERAAAIKRRASELGFSTCGITDLAAPPHAAHLGRWLRDGMAGTMAYMQRQHKRRLDPALILAGSKAAIVVTRNYENPDPAVWPAGKGKVAKYARGEDYHETLREPMELLAQTVRDLQPGATAKAFMDAGPVPERELGQRAGLGWIGKNTMLIDPRRGSYFFIGSVLTNVDVALDPPFEADRCGTCRRCLDACPTDAFPEARVLDSRRCISYLTIEFRGRIEDRLAKRMGGWVFGCDECQTVCPWNVRFAKEAGDSVLGQDANLAALDLGELSTIADAEFEERFGRTAMMRAGGAGMRRNATVALRAAEPVRRSTD